MKVAVIGAGFCGLATSYHLLKLGAMQVTIFDGNGIGNGASGVAAGLLHPFAGAHAKMNSKGNEAMAATEALLLAAENALHLPVYEKSGLLRLATTEAQIADFKKSSVDNPDVKWMTHNEYARILNGIGPFDGIFIERGYVVDCKSYLNGLFKACQNMGAELIAQPVKTLRELDRYDHVIAATGALTTSIPELSHLKVEKVKGQVLEFQWPGQSPPLPFPISSHAYLLAGKGKSDWIGGATFEHHFKSLAPDRDEAIRQIIPKLRVFYPGIDQAHVSDCRSGVRASTAGHRPLIARIAERQWVLTGMGSKGLLYHALYSADLANRIFSSA